MENLTQLFSTQSSIYILFGAAFLGGLISSISPCSLSMLPLIIGYIGGYSDEKPLKTLLQMIVFVIGSGIVFSIIGEPLDPLAQITVAQITLRTAYLVIVHCLCLVRKLPGDILCIAGKLVMNLRSPVFGQMVGIIGDILKYRRVV